MAVSVDSLQAYTLSCELLLLYNAGQEYHVVVRNVENELAESIWTSATVLHGPVEMDFNAPSCKSKLRMYIV